MISHEPAKRLRSRMEGDLNLRMTPVVIIASAPSIATAKSRLPDSKNTPPTSRSARTNSKT